MFVEQRKQFLVIMFRLGLLDLQVAQIIECLGALTEFPFHYFSSVDPFYLVRRYSPIGLRTGNIRLGYSSTTEIHHICNDNQRGQESHIQFFLRMSHSPLGMPSLLLYLQFGILTHFLASIRILFAITESICKGD